MPDVRDVTTRRTLASFGYEWTTFDSILPEDEEFWENYFADVPLGELEGRVALDAGCGKGRYALFTAPHVKSLAALDGSDAVRSAVRNLSIHPNVTVVKGDLRRAPFAAGSFDFVYCLGVLHHLDDPRAGFLEIVRLLSPGGLLLIYVYSRPENKGIRSMGLRSATLIRRLTVRMPLRLLRLVSRAIAPLLWLAFVIPGTLGDALRIRRLSRLPLGTYRRRPLRSLQLDTFDRLSAPCEARYVWPEIEPWFEQAGLTVESVRESAGLFVVARRPGIGNDRARAPRSRAGEA